MLKRKFKSRRTARPSAFSQVLSRIDLGLEEMEKELARLKREYGEQEKVVEKHDLDRKKALKDGDYQANARLYALITQISVRELGPRKQRIEALEREIFLRRQKS